MMKFYFCIFFAFLASFCRSQKIYTVAGTGSAGYYGDGGSATQAHLGYPSGSVTTDAWGNLYIADYDNHRVRKVDHATGIISTIAGTGTMGYNGDSIAATTAQLNYPSTVALDASGNIYIAEYSGRRIRKISAATGKIYTVIGDGTYSYNGDNIASDTTKCKEITGLAIDSAGNIYYTDMGNSIVRKISVATGIVHTIAGTAGMNSFSGDGGQATSATMETPWGICLDKQGNLYIADRTNFRIRKVNLNTGIISTVAGNGGGGGFSGDGGPATSAHLYNPSGVAIDPWGNLFIADSNNDRVRKVDASGTITTFAGGGPYTQDGVDADSAYISTVMGVYIDPSGAMYISEYFNPRIRKISCFDVYVASTNDKCPGSCDGTVLVSVSGGRTPYTYNWLNGLGNDTAYGGLCSGTYTVTVTDSTNCKVNGFATIAQPAPILISIANTNAACLGNGSAIATVSGGTTPYQYSWSNGSTLPQASGLNAGVYTLIVTDTNNCVATKIDTILNYPAPFASAPICMVTVDSSSQHNIIVWDKTPYTNVDSFIIYRETSTNVYSRIGAISYSSLSEFIDTVRTLYFPNTGDPNNGTYRYKMQTLDTCGTYSLLSPYHNTIFIINNGNGTFYWTQLYSIEGGANPVNNYVLERDNTSTGNFQQVTSVAGTQQTINDPLYAVYQNTATWRVKTVWNIVCNPTLRSNSNALSGFSCSYSNSLTNNPNGISDGTANVALQLFPNPNSGKFSVIINGAQQGSLAIYNAMGDKVYARTSVPTRLLIDLTDQPAGIYYIHLTTKSGSVSQKLIIR